MGFYCQCFLEMGRGLHCEDGGIPVDVNCVCSAHFVGCLAIDGRVSCARFLACYWWFWLGVLPWKFSNLSSSFLRMLQGPYYRPQFSQSTMQFSGFWTYLLISNAVELYLLGLYLFIFVGTLKRQLSDPCWCDSYGPNRHHEWIFPGPKKVPRKPRTPRTAFLQDKE